MKLVGTVDVEEDQWGITLPRYATALNVRRLPTLQKLLHEFGSIPTYLLTYPVANDPRAVAILQEILDGGGCEIGMHCHPWTTPPYGLMPLLVSRYIHRLLHFSVNHQAFRGRRLERLISKTQPFRYLQRYHLLHHKNRSINFNLVLGGDWLFVFGKTRNRLREILE